MNDFEKYLSEKRFSTSTITTYCYLVSRYLKTIDGRPIKKINYNSIVKYITYLRRNNNDISINLHLIAIRHYFNFKNLKYNPVKTHIKRKQTFINSNTFSQEQLENIYDSFVCDDTSTSVRDKVLLGLFVFQGIQVYEVKYMKVMDIDFKISWRKTKYDGKQSITGIMVYNNYIDAPSSIKERAKKEQSFKKDYYPLNSYLNRIRVTNINMK